jgi:PAS domain S-box-containing protein
VAVVSAGAAVFFALSRKRLMRELERGDRALQLSEERYRLLLEQASDAIVVADAETGAIIEVNHYAGELLGWQEHELMGRRHTILYPESQREIMRAKFAEHARRGEILERESTVMHRNGAIIPVHIRATLITTGARRYFQAILRDLRPRLESEAAVRRSEARIRQLFERVPVAILETDYTAVGLWLDELRRSGVTNLSRHLETHLDEVRAVFARVVVVGANPAALRASGAPDFQTFLKETGPEGVLVSPELTVFRGQLDAIWNGRAEMISEMRFKRIDGRVGHGVMYWSAPRLDQGLDLTHATLVFSDLSDLRETEARLREVEDRWQLAVRALNVGIFEKNYLTGQNFLSDRWKEILGFGPGELDNGDDWQARVHPEDRDRVVAQLQEHLRGENDLYRVEYRMLCRDGSYKWITACGRAVFDAEGRPERFIGAHMDITERMAAEEALRSSEVRYRRLFEDSPNPMWVYDLESYRFLAVNQAALDHYGYEQEEFLTLTIRDIRPPEELPVLDERLRQGTTVLGESRVWKHRKKNGTTMLMSIRSHVHEFSGRRAVLVLAEDVTEREYAEERLRQSEQRYRNLFENAAEGVYDTTAAGKFLSVNPALARMLGYSSPAHLTEAIRSAALDFYCNPRRRDEFFKVLGSSQSVTGFESEVRCCDGSVRWISENVRAVRDASGELTHFEGFVSDITDRKRAEAVIRASEERYRVLFEHSPVAIVEHDYRPISAWIKRLRDQGVEDLKEYLKAHPDEVGIGFERFPVVGVNEEAVRLTRAGSKRELIERFDRIFLPDGLSVREQAFYAVWEGQQEIEGEITIRALDGSIRRTYFRWWLPKLDGPEASDWTQVVLLDLTDMRSAEAELAAERERLRVTLRAMAEGLLTTDTLGVVQFMNDAAERLTGWTAGAAIGRTVDQICVLRHEKTKADVAIPVVKAIAEHRVIDFPLQTSLLNRHGLPCLIDGRCAPMHDGTGQAIGAVVVFRDVTERARLEAELLRSSKLEAVGILAGGIAHDFNNILTVVMGNVTLAMLDSVVMEAAGRWLAEAERGVMRARDLTQQLLTFAKGGQPIRKAVQLPEIVREAAEFALHGSKVRCEFVEEPDVWPADVDQGQIGQVVQNLVINAVQAMPEGGVVSISLCNEQVHADSPRPLAVGNYLRLTFSDTGSGIRAEHLARIFDPYFTTKQSGSGLGLATVYSIVRKHQGHVEVESELGKGTRFIIWLPAAPEGKPVLTETPEKVAHLSGRVLFMDDEETICTLAVSLLTRLGLEVTAVPDGEAAIEKFNAAREDRKPYQLVIMDLTVPGGMGGREAMQALLKIDPNVRAIVSSGYSSDPVLSNYRAHGFRGVVPKPYRITDLARTISAVMNE